MRRSSGNHPFLASSIWGNPETSIPDPGRQLKDAKGKEESFGFSPPFRGWSCCHFRGDCGDITSLFWCQVWPQDRQRTTKATHFNTVGLLFKSLFCCFCLFIKFHPWNFSQTWRSLLQTLKRCALPSPQPYWWASRGPLLKSSESPHNSRISDVLTGLKSPSPIHVWTISRYSFHHYSYRCVLLISIDLQRFSIDCPKMFHRFHDF